MSATPIPVPNLVQICTWGASVQMGYIQQKLFLFFYLFYHMTLNWYKTTLFNKRLILYKYMQITSTLLFAKRS